MSHDLIKSATRRRMAETGERSPCRHVRGSREHEVFKAVAAELASMGQQVRRNATSASGIIEIERRFKAVHWFRGREMASMSGHPGWTRIQVVGGGGASSAPVISRLDGAAGWVVEPVEPVGVFARGQNSARR